MSFIFIYYNFSCSVIWCTLRAFYAHGANFMSKIIITYGSNRIIKPRVEKFYYVLYMKNIVKFFYNSRLLSYIVTFNIKFSSCRRNRFVFANVNFLCLLKVETFFFVFSFLFLARKRRFRNYTEECNENEWHTYERAKES